MILEFKKSITVKAHFPPNLQRGHKMGLHLLLSKLHSTERTRFDLISNNFQADQVLGF